MYRTSRVLYRSADTEISALHCGAPTCPRTTVTRPHHPRLPVAAHAYDLHHCAGLRAAGDDIDPSALRLELADVAEMPDAVPLWRFVRRWGSG